MDVQLESSLTSTVLDNTRHWAVFLMCEIEIAKLTLQNVD